MTPSGEQLCSFILVIHPHRMRLATAIRRKRPPSSLAELTRNWRSIIVMTSSRCVLSSPSFSYVKSKRASISPNFNFLGQLLEYERQLRAEEVLDSSIGDISTAPVTRCALGLVSGVNVKNLPCGLGGRERLSRSISLSLSLKSPLETVPSSPDQSPIEEVDDSVDRGIIGGQQQPASLIQQADLSPTTALARLTFDAMETDQQSEVVSS